MNETELPGGIFDKSGESGESTPAANFLAAIVASSDDAIISKDLNGIISSWNDGARRIFGWEANEIIGQSILRLIPTELHHEETFILEKIRAAERVEHFETNRIRKMARDSLFLSPYLLSKTITEKLSELLKSAAISLIGRRSSV